MTRMLICYYSKSGTTEDMAESILQGAENSEARVDVEMKKVENLDVKDLLGYHGIILGSPTYYGLPCAEIKKLLDESVMIHGKLDGVVGGAFTSSANPAGGNETTIIALLEALLIHGMIVKGSPSGDHYGPVVVGDPDEKELEQCREYGKVMAKFTDEIAGSED